MMYSVISQRPRKARPPVLLPHQVGELYSLYGGEYSVSRILPIRNYAHLSYLSLTRLMLLFSVGLSTSL